MSAGDHLWTMRDGTKIPVKDMSDSHLRNAYRMLKRKGFISPELLAFCISGPRPQGEMASCEFDQEFDLLLDRPCSSFIDYFEAEAKNRGITLEEES